MAEQGLESKCWGEAGCAVCADDLQNLASRVGLGVSYDKGRRVGRAAIARRECCLRSGVKDAMKVLSCCVIDGAIVGTCYYSGTVLW